jgi:hypothetical protein
MLTNSLDVDHQQVQDAADHRHMGGTSSTWSTISATSALRASGDWLAVMASTAAPRSRALSATSSSSGDAAAAADDHGHVAGLQHAGGQQLQARVGVGVAGHAEAQELELRVLGHHAVVAHGVELDAGAPCSSSMARSIISRLSWLAHCRMAEAVLPSTLAPSSTHAVVAGHLGVRDRHRAGQAGGQPQLEVRQALAAQGAAEADHRGLADLRGARDLGDRVVQHRARVRQHMVGHAQLGRRQLLAGAPDLAPGWPSRRGLQAQLRVRMPRRP